MTMQKKQNLMGCLPTVSERTKAQHSGIGPNQSTILGMVKSGQVGVSPVKRRTKSDLTTFYVQKNEQGLRIICDHSQINGDAKETGMKRLCIRVNSAVRDSNSLSTSLLRRLVDATALNFSATKSSSTESRRVLWTTHRILKLWFDNLIINIVELGFGRMKNGELFIPDDQLEIILNLDETSISMDGSTGKRGGRPEVLFYNLRFPLLGVSAGKSALTTTVITGSTAAGEALPPHFQFTTKATSEERQRLKVEIDQFMPKISGKFGANEKRLWPVTFGMNEMMEMNDEEFENIYYKWNSCAIP